MNDVVWSVNILISIGLLGVIWVIYQVFKLSSDEEKNSPTTHSNKTSDS